jgi:hypothetical protein
MNVYILEPATESLFVVHVAENSAKKVKLDTMFKLKRLYLVNQIQLRANLRSNGLPEKQHRMDLNIKLFNGDHGALRREFSFFIYSFGNYKNMTFLLLYLVSVKNITSTTFKFKNV